ncbi:hypothetical protein L2E82_27266 [Cichorium intybus]|uniref:Uncharacterized protein n=1 Tax=Cichorium intybus TaxID=13427 RepID=A0ACB9CSJ1_CICIN|nr:hypothetical protein L2E82_27266 [Cichorium intybus]
MDGSDMGSTPVARSRTMTQSLSPQGRVCRVIEIKHDEVAEFGDVAELEKKQALLHSSSRFLIPITTTKFPCFKPRKG